MLYTAFIVLTLYNYLKEAYIDVRTWEEHFKKPEISTVSSTDLLFQELLGKGAEDEGDPGLTQGGRRISV